MLQCQYCQFSSETVVVLEDHVKSIHPHSILAEVSINVIYKENRKPVQRYKLPVPENDFVDNDFKYPPIFE